MEPSKKQFLLMVDELGAALLGKLMPSLQLVEIQAMPLKDNESYQILVNPVAHKVDTDPKEEKAAIEIHS
jgi:hypothetical protein